VNKVQTRKRKFSTVLALAPFATLLSACRATAMGTKPPAPNESQQRFKGIGLTLVVDAMEGAEMLGVEFFTAEREFPFYAKSRMVRSNREIMSFPGGVVPEKVRVIWRDNDKMIGHPKNDSRNTYGGKILGDYTLPIASRIPDAVLQDIRKNGGGLRLKFRLKPDGVMFGWDIERFSGGLPRHSMPGGDFLETWY
jgi:hypothetical protein